MNNLNTKVIISWVLLSAVFFVISNSLETDDQFENIDRHADSQGKREIIEIKIPRRRKRSVDSTIRFPLKAFGRDINLNLRQPTGILFSSKTPVYFTKTRRWGTSIDMTYNMFNSSILSKLYVDEEKKAAFTLRTNATDGSTKIQYGFIGSENLVIDQLKPDAFLDSRSDISYNQDHYVATSIADEMSRAASDIIGVGVNRRQQFEASTRLPETIYPEVLIIVDYAVYRHFGEEGIVPYLTQFWNGVNLYYRPLRNPNFRLSIAGVIIAQDENVFEFLFPLFSRRGQGLIRYHSVLSGMSSWLQRARDAIPFNTYDSYIVMTPYLNGVERPSGMIGLASMSSACNGVNGGEPLGGVVYEPLNLQGILTAVHELGHVLGANHDEHRPCSSHSIMAPYDSASNEIWSQCSIDSFHTNLRNKDFSCMYNEPDLDNGDAGWNDNPPSPPPSPPVNTQIPHDPDRNNGQPSEFHVEITDDRDQLTVSSLQFLPDRKVWVYYRNNKLVITQFNTDESLTMDDPNVILLNLRMYVPDNRRITISPSRINPSELIYIYHENGHIYAYQGSKPMYNTNQVSQPSDNNNLGHTGIRPPRNYIRICFTRFSFQLNKLVVIYYLNIDDDVHASQLNAPDNPYVNYPPPLDELFYGQYVNQSILFPPNFIKPGKVLCIWHVSGKIYAKTGFLRDEE